MKRFSIAEMCGRRSGHFFDKANVCLFFPQHFGCKRLLSEYISHPLPLLQLRHAIVVCSVQQWLQAQSHDEATFSDKEGFKRNLRIYLSIFLTI